MKDQDKPTEELDVPQDKLLVMLEEHAVYSDGVGLGIAALVFRRAAKQLVMLRGVVSDEFELMCQLADAVYNTPEWDYAIEEIGQYVTMQRERDDE